MAKEIVLDIKPKENKFKVYLPWIGAIVIVAGIFFSSGYGIGRYTKVSLLFFEENTPTKSATREDWYVHQSNNFSLEYPKGWEVKANSKEEGNGGKILGDGGKIEFWFDLVKPFKFTLSQKKNQEKAKTSTLKIDGRSAKVVEYPYKDNNIFIEIKVSKGEKKQKIVFWLNAANNSFKKTLLEILSTFKTETVTGKIN